MTEISGGGAVVQLEGLKRCCVSMVQDLSTLSAKAEGRLVFNPAANQSLFCPQCGETLVFRAGAWRSKRYMGETHQEFSLL